MKDMTEPQHPKWDDLPEQIREQWIERVLRQPSYFCDRRDEFAVYVLAQEYYEDWAADQELACGVGGTWVPIRESE